MDEILEYPFSAEQALAILKHIGTYGCIELIDKELISEWVRNNTDDNFHQILNALPDDKEIVNRMLGKFMDEYGGLDMEWARRLDIMLDWLKESE